MCFAMVTIYSCTFFLFPAESFQCTTAGPFYSEAVASPQGDLSAAQEG